MGRRHRGHAFMPGKWVFPGGRIDRADFGVPAASELTPPVAAALERTATGHRARALACAAIRETFEETGLLLGKAAAGSAEPSAKRGTWGDFLARAVPDLAALDFVARAITPPARTRRFDARFFMADASTIAHELEEAENEELLTPAWLTLSEARALDLPSITRTVLDEVEARMSEGADPSRPIPFYRFTRGKPGLTHI